MAGLADAVLLLQAKNYSGSGDWLDESGNSHDGVITGATYVSDGIESHFVFDGDDYITVADHPDLDFGNTDDFTLLVVASIDDATPAEDTVFVHKTNSSGSVWAGYAMGIETDGDFRSRITDDDVPTSEVVDIANGASDGVKAVFAMRRDAGTDLEGFVDGVPSGSPTADNTTGSLANAYPFRIGAAADASIDRYLSGKVYAVALIPLELTDAEIVSVGNALSGAVPTLTLLGA